MASFKTLTMDNLTKECVQDECNTLLVELKKTLPDWRDVRDHLFSITEQCGSALIQYEAETVLGDCDWWPDLGEERERREAFLENMIETFLKDHEAFVRPLLRIAMILDVDYTEHASIMEHQKCSLNFCIALDELLPRVWELESNAYVSDASELSRSYVLSILEEKIFPLFDSDEKKVTIRTWLKDLTFFGEEEFSIKKRKLDF